MNTSDKMETDDSYQRSDQELQHDNSLMTERVIWNFMNNTIITLLDTLSNEKEPTSGTQDSLDQLLDSLLSRSNSLNILVPQITNSPPSPDVQQQYKAFTTWLFGVMFYLVNVPVNPKLFKKIIDMQVCMMRNISPLNLEIHENITSEYLNILDEMIYFSNKHNGPKSINLTKFQTDQDAIANMKLAPFSVIIKYEDISIVQSVILKIISESDVSTWPTTRLKNQILEILKYSEPRVKLNTLHICVKMFDYGLLNADDVQNVVLYATEIIKSLSKWNNDGCISINLTQEQIKMLKKLISLTDDPIHNNLHLDIFFALINLNSTELKLEACQKIENDLNECPRFCKEKEIDRFIDYFHIFPQFMKVLVCFLSYEIENNISNSVSRDMTHVSKLWTALKNYFLKNLQLEKFEETLNFLQLTSLLDFQLAQKKLSFNLIDTDMSNIISLFLQSLANNYKLNKLVFENLTKLISLREVDKIEIQNILVLPWSDSNALTAKITKNHLANAKSLDSVTKVKCLNAIIKYGKGHQRLDILNMCISSCDIELSLASVINCPMLLSSKDLKFQDIFEKVLVPAYNTQKPSLHEALASIMGQLACIISEDGSISRNTKDFDKWEIKCKCCDNAVTENLEKAKVVSPKYEMFFKSLFELLDSESEKVCLIMSKNMIKLSNHVKCFNSNSIAPKWIKYIKKENEEIRYNFGKAIGIILTNRIDYSIVNKDFQDDIPSDLEEFVKIIMDNLVSALNEVFDNCNQSLHHTLLFTTKNAACIQSHLTERRCLNIIILTMLHVNSSPLVIALATDSYKEIAMYHKVSPKTLYIRYKKDFLKLMMTLAVHNRINHDYNMSTSIHRVAKCMGFQGSRQLLRKDGHDAVCFLLPLIVKHRKAITLFHDIAELINAVEKDMFKSYFQHICCRVFLFENTENGFQIFKLVTDITKTSIPLLTANSFTLIISELMLHFHSQKEKVLKHLQFLSKYDDQQSASFRSQHEIAHYLNTMLHGVLVTFDANLGANTEELMQKYALASLAEVIDYMGPTYMTQYKYKVLATLRTALNFTRPGFRKLACNAWNAFLRNIPVKELGPLLATICMSLVPLLEAYPKETNSMLDYILIQHKYDIQEHWADLFFIGDLKVSPEISKPIIAHINNSRPKTVLENLWLWIKRLRHQTDEVRLKALLHLQQFLAKNRDGINDLILTDGIHPRIVELLDTLMAGCQDKDENICIASGDCIGELGAIEPSLLPRRIVSRVDAKFIPDVNQEFIYALFCELVEDYQSQKNTQSMDCFSLAIQEILRACEISPGGKNSKLWNSLPSKTQHMIFPLLSSHYKRTAESNDELPSPIYGSESGSTFETWAFNWTVSMLRGIKDNMISNVLNACRPAFKRNIKIMTFCIPYVVTYLVSNGTVAETKALTAEIMAVISVDEKSHVDRELSRNRPLRAQIDIDKSKRVSDEARRVRCLQVIFSTLDHLQRWLREKRRTRDAQYEKIERFCDGFPKLLLAQGCYQSYEYHRALIYLEQHMASSKKGLSDSTEGGLLAKIYTQLEEPDGVSGILVSQEKYPTLQQLVLAHEVSGQFQDAATCYERLLQSSVPKPMYIQGMIQCYLGLHQPFTATSLTKSVLGDRPELETMICDMEPFWQLAHFGQIGSDSKHNIKMNLLEDLKKNLRPDLLPIKKKLVSLLTASSRPGAYEQSYSYIMKLHIVNEFEKACTTMLDDLENLPSMFSEWEKRDKLINASRGAEFVLGMRRAILDLAAQLMTNANSQNNKVTEEIGKLWLKSAKIARKTGLYQQAYMYILSATDICPPQDLCIEQSQLYWQKGSYEDALLTLKRCLSTFFKSTAAEYKSERPEIYTVERKQCAKAHLLWAKYNDETLNVDANGNMANYKEANDIWKGWEKSQLAIAKYYESVIDKMTEDERMSTSGRDMQTHIINFYGKALYRGCKYIHESLPRMLTVWLNYASRVRMYSASDSAVLKTLTQMTKIIDVYIERLPIFVWLTAFSQLVSRICHPNREVQNTLFTIIVKLIKAYPQHCLWMMASVFNSSYTARQKCCKEILNRDALKTKEMINLIHCFHKLWERLVELSNKHIPEGVQTTTVNVLSRSLPKLLADPDFGPIMMPTSKFRQLNLPSKDANIKNHYPFTPNWVQLVGIEDTVAVMPSLQRPRRIGLKGSDGTSYLFMCKPKDDLRRDFRLMEFNDIVNKYLQKDPESRRRRLYIRTYSVVPLNEECGLIEWVPNLIGYRNILINLYKERNILITSKEIKSMTCALKDPLEKKRENFLQKLLPRHPPVLGDWFHFAFPDSYGWYEARTAYIRTAAVMSMVGYILGLGDRHGENILIDSKCGDCVHVDFNCLFNRGESLEWPERVPFRLTHNMVEAMGPLKYEGPFRQSCRTTMKVLREQASTLISVLKPFVYDPLVSWNKNQVSDAGEKTNEKAVENIKSIEDRLKGMVGSRGKRLEAFKLYLSVEGQVNHLILDAINVDNLCQMYIGWGPYL